jgi:lysozyme
VTPESRSLLNKALMRDEDIRLKPYRDTMGKLTIGVGRNIEDRGISVATAMQMLGEDVDIVLAELDQRIPWWRGLDEVRQRVVANLAFNMGTPKLLGFRRMLDALKDGRNDDAADELLDSVYAWQVKGRAIRLAESLRTGKEA